MILKPGPLAFPKVPAVEYPPPLPKPAAPPTLPPQQLRDIKAQLDLVLLALEALVGIGSDAVVAAAAAMDLSQRLGDRVSLWRLRQASPLRKGQGRKKLDVDEARALVLVSCYLATQHQRQIRDAVAELETALDRGTPVHRIAILGDYLDSFCNAYQERMQGDPNATSEEMRQIALKLLVDLLFYSNPRGDRRLWGTLLERSQGESIQP